MSLSTALGPLPPSTALLRGSDFALLLVALVWGSSYGVAKTALVYYPVLAFLAVRFALTSALLLPVWWRMPRPLQRDALRTGLPLGGWMLLVFVAETYGVAHTQASQAAFLISLCVVLTPLVQWWLLGQRPGAAVAVFAALSLGGAALLADVTGWSGRLSWGWGEGLMLVAAGLRAVLTCETARRCRASQASALAVTAVQSVVVAGGCAVLMGLTSGSWPPLPRSALFWQATMYLVVGCTLFAFLAQNWALRHSPPSRVALLMGSEPVFGALVAVLWLGESLAPLQWLGGALMTGSALWMTLHRGGPAATGQRPGLQPPSAT